MQELHVVREGSDHTQRLNSLGAGALDGATDTRQRRVIGLSQRLVDAPQEGVVGVLFGDGAEDVQGDDVLRALPDGVTLGVAELACQGPALDVAVAAEHLQPLAGDLQTAAGGAELGERHHDAVQPPRLLVAGAPGERRGLEHGSGSGLDFDGHLEERLLNQGQLVQPAPERLTMGGVDRRFQEAATGDAQPHGSHAQPRAVDHAHHPVQPPRLRGVRFGVAKDIGLGIDEIDLGSGHGAGAQLVLDAFDVDAVRGAVGTGNGDDEEGEAAQAGVGAFGPSEGGDRLGVHVGAEPLGAVEQPGALVHLFGGRIRGGEVGAAADLGHEHGAVPAVIVGGRHQVGHQLLADAGWRVAVDERGDAAGHAGGADHAGVRLAEEVGEGAAQDGRHILARRLQGVGAFLPDVALGIDGVRVMLNAVGLIAPGVVALQARRVTVDHLGVSGDGPTAYLAPALQPLLGPAAVLGRQVAVHQRFQVGVDLVPVEADGGLQLRVVDRISHGVASQATSLGPARVSGEAEVGKGGNGERQPDCATSLRDGFRSATG